MTRRILNSALSIAFAFTAALLSSSCESTPVKDSNSKMVVSVRDQRILLVQGGKPIKAYAVSTSKFGIGSQNGSNHTPLGNLEIARKIGDGAPAGMVFKTRHATGEVLKPNAPGRDAIVSRIMWLHGMESQNSNTFSRCVYIHGTPEECHLGTPASYGCIRMGMKDVVDLYDRVGEGAQVKVIRGPLSDTAEGQEYARYHSSDAVFLHVAKN